MAATIIRGRRGASRRAERDNAIALGVSIEVEFSLIFCRVNGDGGNGGMDVGEACLSPPNKCYGLP